MKSSLALSDRYRIRIRTAGAMPMVGKTTSPWSTHCTYQITSFRAANLTVHHRETEHHAHTRGVWLIPANERFRIQYQSLGELEWIHFSVINKPNDHIMANWTDYNIGSPDRLAMIDPPPRDVWGIDLPTLIPDHLLDDWQTKLTQAVSLWYYQTPTARIDAEGLLADCLHQLVRDQRAQQLDAALDPIEQSLLRAEMYVRKHLERSPSVEIMADIAGYERSHFTMLYKSRRHLPPGTFIRETRMNQAALLLRTQALPVQLVSQLVGYPNPTTFGRAFKKHFHQTPGQYQAQHQSKPVPK